MLQVQKFWCMLPIEVPYGLGLNKNSFPLWNEYPILYRNHPPAPPTFRCLGAAHAAPRNVMAQLRLVAPSPVRTPANRLACDMPTCLATARAHHCSATASCLERFLESNRC